MPSQRSMALSPRSPSRSVFEARAPATTVRPPAPGSRPAAAKSSGSLTTRTSCGTSTPETATTATPQSGAGGSCVTSPAASPACTPRPSYREGLISSPRALWTYTPRLGFRDSPATASPRTVTPLVPRGSEGRAGSPRPLPAAKSVVRRSAPSSSPQARLRVSPGPEALAPGAVVSVGPHRLRCSHVLGRGSFSEVWSAEVEGGGQELALKETLCKEQSTLNSSMFEVGLLKDLQDDELCIPHYIAHSVDQRLDGASQVRVAMSRVAGEPLDMLLKRHEEMGRDAPGALVRGAGLAVQLLKQLGTTLESVSRLAWHRDVNPRNVLISDASTGGAFHFQEGQLKHVRFDLIDFGLAVDSQEWPLKWRTEPVAGDCRYWAVSSWLVSFFGPPALEAHEGLLRQYERELDSYALGVMALELLCTPALANATGTGSSDPLRGSWRRLLTAWTKFRQDVSQWHKQVHKVFATGGSMRSLYQRLVTEQLPEKARSHASTLCACLRACIDRAEDPALQNLLWVIAALMDEDSAVDLASAIRVVSGEGIYPLQQPAAQSSSSQAAFAEPSPPQTSVAQMFKSASALQPSLGQASLSKTLSESQPSLPQTVFAQKSLSQSSLLPSQPPLNPPTCSQPVASPGASFTPTIAGKSCVAMRSLSPPRLGASLTATAAPAASPCIAHRL